MPKHSTASDPYISFITCSRNDDYAGGVRKLYWSTLYLGEQCDQAGLPAESVIVEWNPPVDREGLATVLRDLPARRKLSVRIITVPGRLHARYTHSRMRPVHGAVAVNVGLRRARGRFLVVKVADAFYPDSLIQALAAGRLDSECMYRAKRVEIVPEAAGTLGLPRKDFLAYCEAHVSVRNEHLPQPQMPFRLPDLFTNASGDFQLLSRERWYELRGYWESSDVLAFEADSMLSYSAYAAGIREEMLPGGQVYKISHGASHANRVASRKSRFADVMLFMESVLRRIGLGTTHVFWMRALFDYPPKIYVGVRKPVYERSLLRFKLLSLLPMLTRLKSPDWGLGREPLVEAMLESDAVSRGIERKFHSSERAGLNPETASDSPWGEP